MGSHSERQVLFRVTSLDAALLAIQASMAAELASGPANAPNLAPAANLHVPTMFFRDGDKAVVTQRLKDHISTLVGRFKGRIRS